MDIGQAVSDGYCIVAASDRLARDLRVRYSMAQKAAGNAGWFAPEIHSYRAWVSAAWMSMWTSEQLLYGAQELSLWLYAVESTEVGRAILNKTSAARAARQLDRVLKRYGVADAALERPVPGDDETAFREWRRIVAEKLRGKGWVTEDELPWRLAEACRAGQWQPPAKVLWVGFLNETAAQRAVREVVAEAGSQVDSHVGLDPVDGVLSMCMPATRIDQYRLIAARARDRLMPYSGRADVETPRLAILVPDIQEARLTLEPVLREYVAPQSSVAGEHAGRRPWRYARGLPLSEHPMIATALDVLNIEGGADDLATVSRVVLSPWVFSGCAMGARADFEIRLRRAGGTRFRRGRVHKLAQAWAAKRPDHGFFKPASEWFGVLGDVPSEQLPSAWAERWEMLLGAAGWGADSEATRELSQVQKGWSEVLDAFRAMDTQVREVSQRRAVVWLREILAETPFQPAADYLQPIQILGYDDAVGMAFDWVAVCDFTAANAPSAAYSTGFVAGEVLVKAGMLEASPDGCLEKATRWVSHLRTLAPEIEVYAPHLDERGAELVPSRLLDCWGEVEGGVTLDVSPVRAVTQRGVATSLPGRDSAPEVGDAVAEGVRGGVSVLKAMAVSPFVAFARARLGLREFPEAVDGLDASVQGEVVHRVLELVWQRLETSEGLAAQDAGALESMVGECVHQACVTEDRVSEARYGRGLAHAEQARVRGVCLQWLAHERQRALPFRVLMREGKATVDIAGLPLSLRIDRIDEITMPDGARRYLVLDYKTGSGKLSPRVWDPDHLSEPQLPTYAVSTDLRDQGIPRIDGIGFAGVVDEGCAFAIASNFAARLVPDKKGSCGDGDSDWALLLQRWRASLDRLGRAFMGGAIEVDRIALGRSRFDEDLLPLVRVPREADAAAEAVAGQDLADTF